MSTQTELYLEQKKNRLEKELAAYLSAENSPVFEAMRYSVLSGGKRFRPLLLLASGEQFGAPEELLLPYACAVELIHNYSLIHDDLPLMDNDDFRRGQPTCHRKFGEALALLAGDALLTLAFEILAGAPAPNNNHPAKNWVVAEIARAAGPSGMIAGQWLDISFNPENKELQSFQEMFLKKTAGLIRVSAVSGAALAGAPEEVIIQLNRFGTSLGLAFQLRDDLEDLRQDQIEGKPFRPNLARVTGEKNSRQLLSQWLEEARQSLKNAGIESGVLFYFVDMISSHGETSR
ncbi:MAG: polyprenyl synthetase family protein [Candidatus Saccharicenans sp.]